MVRSANSQVSHLGPTSRALVGGRFEIQAVLGEGGMGAVYRARDLSMGKEVALKRLHAHTEARYTELFEREYHTLASLSHPHIVEVHDYGRDNDGPYYCMELLEGSDIQKRSPMPWREAARILRDICSALSLVHARELVHRDVSARNVWCTPQGHIKLIDFGALCRFGRPPDVVGTPPFVPPEALWGGSLDQRSDLFSVGALGYWLITGMSAFPAQSLSQLHEAWKIAPRPASVRVADLRRPDLPEAPVELDALLAALLTLDQHGRPDSAAEVVARLTSVADLDESSQQSTARSHLISKQFVGRAPERGLIASLLKRAKGGNGTSVWVESEQGLGRTRLLGELALMGRLAGGAVVESNAAEHGGIHGLVIALAHKLLQTHPELARSAAQPQAAVLGHLAPSLMEALGLQASQLVLMPQVPGEARMRMQSALHEWFLAVTAQEPLALFVDDVQAADEASVAWLTGLVQLARSTHLLVVVGYRVTTDVAPDVALSTLRNTSRVLKLSALASEEMALLLGSMFGQVPNLGRLVEVLSRASEGVPEHCLELAEHLVDKGLIRLVDGAWVLPAEVDEGMLPIGRAQRLAARLARLPEDARNLGRTLSVCKGLFHARVCAAISSLGDGARRGALNALVHEGILVYATDGFRFAHAHVRVGLYAELSPTEARHAHHRLGTFLRDQSSSNALSKLEAGYHLLLGAPDGARLDQNAAALVAQAGMALATVETALLASACPLLEECLAIFRRHGRGTHELISLLAPLTVAGYYADRRWGVRYGEPCIEAMERVLGLRTALVLQRWLGNKLGLFLALVPVMIGFALRSRNPCVPSFRDAMVLLIISVSTVHAARVMCVDTIAAQRTLQVLKPLAAFGRSHAAAYIYEICRAASLVISDRPAEARSRYVDLIARLEDGRHIEGLTDDVRTRYLAALLFAYGVTECWRDDSRALEIADKLESFGMKLYQLTADQLRMSFYLNQGRLDESRRYGAKVELHAIQCGTAWQVQTWAPGAMLRGYLRAHDAMRLKQCMEALEQLSKDVLSLAVYTKRARGAYLLSRGKVERSLEWLRAAEDETPRAVVGWAFSMGTLATALNELGRHAEAKRVSEAALAGATPEDLEYVAMYSGTQIQHALALAGLGQRAEAVLELSALLHKHEKSQGLLTLGAIHEALASVYAATGREQEAAHHASTMEGFYRATRIPSLIERCERTRWKSTTHQGDAALEVAGSENHSHLVTVAHQIRVGGTSDLGMGAEWALLQLARYAGLRECYLFVLKGEQLACVANVDGVASPGSIHAWAEKRIQDLSFLSDITQEVAGLAAISDDDRAVLDDKRYRFVALSAGIGTTEHVIGALVAREAPEGELHIPDDLLRAVAERVQDMSQTSSDVLS